MRGNQISSINENNHLNRENAGLVGAICGSLLLGLPTIPLATLAETNSLLNPCPGIYYEEPYNSRILVPEGCPPNARTIATQGLGPNQGGQFPEQPQTPAVSPSTPPLPGERQEPVAIVMPANGMVDVKLVNNTNTSVTYQVVGDTDERILSGRSDTTLRSLEVPVTITVGRPDGGLLMVNAEASEDGMLEVMLTETTDLGTDENLISIEDDGAVFLY